MDDIQTLNAVIATLDSINVPAKYTQQIAVPICNCSAALKGLLKTVLEAAKKQAEEREAAEKEPELMIEPVGMIPEEGTKDETEQ